LASAKRTNFCVLFSHGAWLSAQFIASIDTELLLTLNETYL
jgi:hypothetical protein